MRKLRERIKRFPSLWLACLLPALFFMLALQPHIHVHAAHQQSGDTPGHSHAADLHQAHFGNALDSTAHAPDQHHPGGAALTVDISPDGLKKSFASTLLACALVGLGLLFLLAPGQAPVLQRRRDIPPYIRWRAALPPQLRAPPR